MKRLAGVFLWIGISTLALWLPAQTALAQSSQPVALVMTANGPLTPAMDQYLDRAIATAEQQKAEVLIMQLNTPGGDVNLLNLMITSIRASTVPVVVYVSPQGAMAGSAGTVITLAGHVAAMAPGTAIGAASPVGSQGQDLSQTESAKVKSIMEATVRSLAQHRKPEAVQLAVSTIENASAASAQEALQTGLVDFIAPDVPSLMQQMNGFHVTTVNGDQILNTVGIPVVPLPPTPIEQLLQLLTDPNIVFILLAIGVQAILIELANPGGWIPGFIGVVSLALATYGLGVLPVNWFGIIFLVLAFVLFILDVKAPTHGALTAAGLASFITGSLVLFNSPSTPSFDRVSVPLVIGVSAITAGIFFTIVSFALRARSLPVRNSQHQVLGRLGVARTALNPTGTVQVSGELWTAKLVDDNGVVLAIGDTVEIIGLEGNKLLVRKAAVEQPEEPLDQPTA